MTLPKRVLLVAATLLVGTAQAADYQSHDLQGQTLIITTDEGKVELTAWHAEAFAVHYQPKGVKQLPSFALDGKPISTSVNVSEKPDQLVFDAGLLQAHIDKQNLRIRYYRDGEYIGGEQSGLFAHDTLRGFRFALAKDEKVMGGGQRVLGMDRRGERMPLYNRASYGYGENRTEQMYYGLPLVISSNKYMVVFDNSASGWLDIGKSQQDILQFEAEGGRTAYLFTAAQSYPELIHNYVKMTGTQPLPPRWAMGNIASRFGYRSEKEVRDTIALFRDKQLPVDAIVLDLYWFGTEIKGTMGNLAWHKQTFPTPEQMIADLANDGVKTVLITEPFVLTSSDRWDEVQQADALAKGLDGKAKRFDFYFGNTGLIDVFNPKAQDWFWGIYKQLKDQGVAGWWGDLGEPEVHPYDTIHQLENGQTASANEIHNAYGHQWNKMLYQRLVEQEPESRHFIMMRSGFAGSQRNGMVPWTGDVSRSWSGLKPQVELSLQMGLGGLAWTHSDLGGFAGGESFDQEMYVRWLQYGVFQPVYRPHAQDNIAPEPVFHDERTIELLRPYLNLRYELLPYLYSMAFENSQTGMPLMRPLFFENDDDQALIDNASSYLWGDAFLVTPVIEPGQQSVQVALPDGYWFNFWNQDVLRGGQTVTVASPLEQLPVLVRAGSFIPRVESVQTTRDYSSASLRIDYYHHNSISRANYQMYEDDGSTANAFDKGEYELLDMSAENTDSNLTLQFTRTMPKVYQGAPKQRDIQLVVHHSETPSAIAVNGVEINQWQYDSKTRRIHLALVWDHQPITIKVSK